VPENAVEVGPDDVECRGKGTHDKDRHSATPMSAKLAALYVRVSTDAQTVENQIRELRQVAARRGWDVVEVYSDAGISGAKGRNGRPGLDSMLKDASRRKFDIVMAWAIDRLGRSLIDLLDTIQHLEDAVWTCTWTSRPSTRPRRWAS
jgi:predicted site-specific integrase-resolvase